jgi:single-stranded-DNA-specific exonuclease
MMNCVDAELDLNYSGIRLNQGQTVEDLTSSYRSSCRRHRCRYSTYDRRNRVLAYFGLQVINSNPRPGIKAGSSSKKQTLDITDVVFIIAPRINAADVLNMAIMP